jgi:DNA-binding transcriptional LysR family regulator
MLELSHLRAFVVVASELHFGRAAARLNITQPPLSRQIQALEQTIGVDLFVRTSRSVRLTSAGYAFLREAHRLLEHAEAAVRVARHSAATGAGAIMVGLIGAATYGVLRRLIREAQRALPMVELSFVEMVTPEQLDALARRRIDIGLGRLPSGARGVHTAVIARERLLLAMPDDHPLAALESLRVPDLGVHRFIGYEPIPSTSLYELSEHIFTTAEFTPNIIQRSKQTQTILSMVSAGAGIAIVPEAARHACFSNVIFRDIRIENDPVLEMHAIWRPDNNNPVLPAFRSLLLAICGPVSSPGARAQESGGRAEAANPPRHEQVSEGTDRAVGGDEVEGYGE